MLLVSYILLLAEKGVVQLLQKKLLQEDIMEAETEVQTRMLAIMKALQVAVEQHILQQQQVYLIL
jgi:hypothetical protein